MPEIGRALVVLGAILLVVGLVVMLLGRVPFLGRLPGDVVYRRGNFTLFFPLATSILLSLILTGLLWLLRR
jgi:hypothetical protein